MLRLYGDGRLRQLRPAHQHGQRPAGGSRCGLGWQCGRKQRPKLMSAWPVCRALPTPNPCLCLPGCDADVTGVRATSGEKGGRGSSVCRLCESGERSAQPGSLASRLLNRCPDLLAAGMQQACDLPFQKPLGGATVPTAPFGSAAQSCSPSVLAPHRRQVCGARGAALRVQVPCQRACGHEHPLQPGSCPCAVMPARH